MTIKELIAKHLKSVRVMQLATSRDNKPWACNVHFYADNDFNLYWISTPARRHSQDIELNSHVAVTIKVHEDTPDDKYVIGLSAEGKARLANEEEVKKIGLDYMKRLDKDPSLFDDIVSGRNPHRFYKLSVSSFVLFDSKNFPDSPRKEYRIKV